MIGVSQFTDERLQLLKLQVEAELIERRVRRFLEKSLSSLRLFTPQVRTEQSDPERGKNGMSEQDRISGQFVWHCGYLFLKPDKGNLDDIPAITSPEPGTCVFHKEIQVENLEIGFLSARSIANVPDDLKDFHVIYRMHPRSLSVPIGMVAIPASQRS